MPQTLDRRPETDLSATQTTTQPDAPSGSSKPREQLQGLDHASGSAFLSPGGGLEQSRAPLPHQGAMEAFFGQSFGHVQAHTGPKATKACADLGAEAFTQGDSIAFKSPSPAPTLVAHELTHVVQQRGGVRLKATFGTSGDRFEQKAVANEHAFARGGKPVVSQSGAPDVQLAEEGHTYTDLGADEASDYQFPKSTGSGAMVDPGDVGYAQHASDAASVIAAEALLDPSAERFEKVLPYLDSIEKQISIRSREAEKFQDKADDAINSAAIELWEERAAYCRKNGAMLVDIVDWEKAAFESFNSWTDTANMYQGAYARLEALMEVYGVSDMDAMVAALETGLDDAGQVAELYRNHQRQVGEDGELDPLDKLDIPKPTEDIDLALGDVYLARDEMMDAYIGVRNAEYKERMSAIWGGTKDERQRLAEIEQVKQVVANVGKTVDLTTSIVSGAPTAVTSAADRFRQGEAALSAMGNRKAALSGNRQTYNPTYITTNADGDMVVANALTETTTNLDTGEKTSTTGNLDGGSITLPTSISNGLTKIADFYYADEIKACQEEIAAAKAEMKLYEDVINTNEVQQALDTYATKLNGFALELRDLEATVTTRRNTMREFGEQLDRFAASNSYDDAVRAEVDEAEADRIAGGMTEDEAVEATDDYHTDMLLRGTESGTEKYAAIMTMAAAVESVHSMGTEAQGSLGELKGSDLKKEIEWIVSTRQVKPPQGITKLENIKNEKKRLKNMLGQVQSFEGHWGDVGPRLDPAATALASLMTKLNGAS